VTAPVVPDYRLGAVLPHVKKTAQLVGPMFGITNVLGWRATAVDKMGHPAGLALDFMCSRTQGEQLNSYLLGNAGALGIKYTIWRQTYFVPGKAPEKMPDRGSPTANHEDHVHAQFKAAGGDGTKAADFAGVDTSGTAEVDDDGGVFGNWSGDAANIGITLAVTVAALALLVVGAKKTVTND
jgi:hypothetical protein